MRVVYSHIPKTAGTSVRTYLQGHIAPVGECVYVDDTYGVSYRDFEQGLIASSWRFIAGHVSVSQLLKCPQIPASDTDILVLSFVRDPIDRLVSQFNYIVTTDYHPQHEKLQSIDINDYVMAQIPNLQNQWLSAPGHANPRWRVYIGHIDNVAEVCEQVINRALATGAAAGEFPTLYVTGKGSTATSADKTRTREDLSPVVLESLTETHALDLDLVQRVRQAGILQDSRRCRASHHGG